MHHTRGPQVFDILQDEIRPEGTGNRDTMAARLSEGTTPGSEFGRLEKHLSEARRHIAIPRRVLRDTEKVQGGGRDQGLGGVTRPGDPRGGRRGTEASQWSQVLLFRHPG